MSEEKKKTNIRKTFLLYWNITGRYKHLLLWIMFLYGTGILLADVFTVIIFKKIIDAIEVGTTQMLSVWTLFITLIGLNLSHFVLFRIGDIVWGRYQTAAAKQLHQFVFSKLQVHSYTFFSNSFSGSLVAQSKRFVDAFEDLLDTFIFWIWMNSLELIGSFVVLLFFSWELAFTFLAFIIIISAIVTPFARKKAKLDAELAAQNSKVTARFSDIITNILNVKIFSALKREEKEYGKILGAQANISLRNFHAWNTLTAVQNGLSIMFQITMFGVSLLLWHQGKITAGTVVLAQTYTLSIFHIVWSLTRSVSRVFKSFADADEMVGIIEKPLEILDAKHPETLAINKGEIAFENVTFGYADGGKVFKNFSLHIRAGEKVGLVGPSGGGKTTVTKLLLRFVDPQKGKITIDGQDIKNLKQDDLRSTIAYVPQDPLLFHRSLYENIAYGKEGATLEEVKDAAVKANAHEFIDTLKKKYETLVGERGIKLSGGQRQRVAIARAILKRAPILVLDEATSALDTVSELQIREALDHLMQEKTAIVIAHRLSTVEKMDRIIVLNKDGKIEEEGTHKELIGKKGLYAKLWKHQSGGFLDENSLTAEEIA